MAPRTPLSSSTPAGTTLRQLVSLAGFTAMLFAARSSLADHYYVPTGSMIPTVAIGDRVLVNKLAYDLKVPFLDVALTSFAEPVRGDVVVLQSPEDDKTLLKRVVAVPGDDVVVTGGRLLINGQPALLSVHESQLFERLDTGDHPVRLTHGGGAAFGPQRLPPGRFLVMGDNRGESHDGRAFGLVDRGAIMGRALSVWMRDGRPCWHRL